ncbi:uncharacterized protein PV09_07553 [Verruconis gallopava]|uniref:Condensation domain-containing protein n=1 Tax=Verruconis gallopava TaxID=253628 RepID=A0A0D2A2S8_9PEZI|nr:uncharacterized protein PV09_07553 [Verruconis gallopava]KIW01038.1 hypothetical protein PV09_07553 [Verruconis gallopava]
MTYWLHRYGNKQHAWRKIPTVDRVVYERQLGLVEASFDNDGVHYGGRADLTHSFEFEIRTSLAPNKLRERIVLAWSALRLSHLLMLSKARDRTSSASGGSGDGEELQRCFVVDLPTDAAAAIEEARASLTSLLEQDAAIDPVEFRTHALNSARIVDPTRSLSHLFILPSRRVDADRYRLSFMIVLAHMIADGLSLHNWLGHFNELLNTRPAELYELLVQSLREETIRSRLPPAQEDLYPPIPGSKARQRWFWAIIRILRHVRKPLPEGFVNPLRRANRVTLALEPKFSDVLDYSAEKLPPLNSGCCTPAMSLSASRRLAGLCRSAGTSIGAGVFALVALVMMDIEVQRNPDTPLEKRKPFIASFPLNPRPFFGYAGKHDSCMLAFSDGIVIPFLPPDLPLEGRLKLLAKAAHRQLRAYQKRKEGLGNSHSPMRMLATNYITAVERAEDKLPVQYKRGVNPQGNYPANSAWSAATCGVSSVGLVKECTPGRYNLDLPLGSPTSGERDLIVDFRELRGGVRARDNEFLCGNSSDQEGRLSYAVSYDASAMDEQLVELWKRKMESVLEPDSSESSKL